MTVADLLTQAKKFAHDNSPAILTALAVSGVVTTAVLTGKAALKAHDILQKEKLRQAEVNGVAVKDPNQVFLTPQEQIKLVWKAYIPAAGSAVATMAFIIGANRIGTRRTASMVAAYSIAEKGFTEYKAKVVEKLGEKKEQEVRDEVAQDRVNRDPVGTREVIIAVGGEVLCYDAYSGRYFKSDIETLKKAQNDLNYVILGDSYASLTKFYDKIGLRPTSASDELGWTSDRPLELSFTPVMSEDDRPCISIEFNPLPGPHFYRYG